VHLHVPHVGAIRGAGSYSGEDKIRDGFDRSRSRPATTINSDRKSERDYANVEFEMVELNPGRLEAHTWTCGETNKQAAMDVYVSTGRGEYKR
jgi:hypothetical protein